MRLSEKQLIADIRRKVGRRRGQPPITVGIGDDTAVLRPPRGHELLITTDFSLEGVHFRRDWQPAESAGYRCLARGLSDIAAMGGEPFAALLSLALPLDLPQRWVDGFIRGLLRLARKHNVTLAGGDVSSVTSGMTGVLADIVVVGLIPRGQAVLRSGAASGQRIFVTGELGGAAAGLRILYAEGKARPKRVARHFLPEPRLRIGRYLRQRGLATAMIDVSDGLSTDLRHLCDESGVGAVIREECIPVATGSTVSLALNGGDDYELLFTAPAGARVPARVGGIAITEIGITTRDGKLWLRRGEQKPVRLVAQGWEHFAGTKFF